MSDMPTIRPRPNAAKKTVVKAPAVATRPAPLNPPLTEMLNVTPGTTIVVLGAPAGYRQKLGPLPEGARLVNVVPAEAAAITLDKIWAGLRFKRVPK